LSERKREKSGIRALFESFLKTLKGKGPVALLKLNCAAKMIPGFLLRAFEFIWVELGEFGLQFIDPVLASQSVGYKINPVLRFAVTFLLLKSSDNCGDLVPARTTGRLVGRTSVPGKYNRKPMRLDAEFHLPGLRRLRVNRRPPKGYLSPLCLERDQPFLQFLDGVLLPVDLQSA